MSLGRNQRELWKKYVEYMHDALIDFYVSYQQVNPIKLLVLSEEELKEITERRRFIPLEAEDITKLILQLTRLKAIADELVGIIKEANRFLLHKRVYDSIEEWNVRGIIDWSATLRNIIVGRPIAQKVISYTIRSPENILLRAVVDYTNFKLIELISKIKKIKKQIGNKIPTRAQRGLYGLKVIERMLKETHEMLDEAVKNSFLDRIPENLYSTESLEPMWEFTREVEATPWKPEWVEKLLDLVYTYYANNKLEKELDQIVDLVIDRLIKEPRNVNIAFKIYSYKLYEVYNLYIVLNALRELGADIDLVAHKTIRAKIGNKVLEILYNKTTNELSKIPIKAIPDTTIKNRETIIIEAKFSRNPSYLSQAIFKVLAYIVIFKARIGILTYPSISKKPPIEEEDKQIYEAIFRESHCKYTEITIDTANGEQKITALQLEPLKETEEINIKSIKSLIEEAIL